MFIVYDLNLMLWTGINQNIFAAELCPALASGQGGPLSLYLMLPRVSSCLLLLLPGAVMVRGVKNDFNTHVFIIFFFFFVPLKHCSGGNEQDAV